MEKPPPNYQSSWYLSKRLLLDYMGAHKSKFIMAFFCMIIVAAATASNAWLIQPALDDIFLKKDQTMLLLIPIVVLLISVVKAVASYGQSFLMSIIGQRIITNMQAQLFSHLLYMDLSEISKEASGKIISRFSNDISVLKASVSNVLTGLAKEVLTLIFLITVMFIQSPELSVIAFVVFPVAIYPIISLGKRMRKLSKRNMEELGNFTEQLDETFRGIRVIRAYNAEKYEEKRSHGKLEDIFGIYTKVARTQSISSPIMEMLAGIAIAAVIWYGGSQVMSGHTSPGAFFSFITAMMLAYKPVKTVSGLNNSLQEGMASARRLFELLDRKPTIIDMPKAPKLKVKEGAISLRNVSFQYEPKKPALHDVSIEIEGGKTIALVGSSGGGKSTVMNMILRFYDPQSGEIIIDGHKINQVTQKSLRENISLVSQEIILFDDSVAANISYGNQNASKDEIIAAAKMAAADEFITELPKGYDTVVGQSGLTLSGGQRQRLSIARAILKDAPILLLDEATSALDPISEKKIQAALKKLMKDRTTLVIAHRLTTVEEADLIYVLKRGKVVELGKHDDLIKKKDGHYAKLAKGLE